MSACAYFPNLTSLTMLDVGASQVCTIAEYCKHVQQVSINLHGGAVDVDNALHVAAQWREIRFLELQMSALAADVFRRQCAMLTTLITDAAYVSI